MNPLILKPKACIGCRIRKVKCNRQIPCANCEKWSVDCSYPTPIRRCKRQSKKGAQEKHNETTSRAKDPDALAHQLEPASSSFTCYTTDRPGQLEEQDTASEDQSSLFPSLEYHSCERWHVIWMNFRERVDPIVKILYSPSAESLVTKISTDQNNMDPSELSVLYAIRFASVASMSEQESQATFGTGREVTLAACRLSAEQELAKTQTAPTDIDHDISALQARILFLTVNRMLGEVDVAWQLTGLAKRSSILQRTDLSPLQSELQKRMAWNLWYLDHRAFKDHGQDDGLPRTPRVDPPTNCNDSDIEPKCVTPLNACLGWTEQTFSLVRFDIGTTRNALTDSMCLNKRKTMIEECQERITRKYIRYCRDDTDPVQWLTRHVSHVLIMEMWFELYSADKIPMSPDPGVRVYHDQQFQDHLFLQAIDIVDTSTRLHMEPLSRRWRWLLKGYQQFRPLAFLINELLYREGCSAVSHAWIIVEKALSQQPSQMRHSAHGKALDILKAKAKEIHGRILN